MNRGIAMLREFTFENFRCYKDETTLMMQAASIGEHSDTLLKGADPKRPLLPVAAVYGPNGGGKSSVLQAFDRLRTIVVLPFLVVSGRLDKAPVVSCRPYAFDAESRTEPTTFRVIFEQGDYTYRYILSVLDGRIDEEYLHRRKPGRGSQATLFERTVDGVELGPSLRRKRVNTEVDSRMPLLTFLAINYDIGPVEEAFGWFLSCNVLDYSRNVTERYLYEPSGENEKRRFMRMLNAMDIDVDDIRYKHGGDESEEIEEIEAVYLRHSFGEGGELELSEESNGTQKLVSLVPRLLVALDRGELVVSDELDAKLHPKLLRYIIRLFTDPRTNPNGAQLVFTSHDMSTLNSSVFRRDEIWFAAHGEDGPSVLYSLSDISEVDGKRVRTANSYDRQYLAGKYGADPYLRSMLDWDGDNEQ